MNVTMEEEEFMEEFLDLEHMWDYLMELSDEED